MSDSESSGISFFTSSDDDANDDIIDTDRAIAIVAARRHSFCPGMPQRRGSRDTPAIENTTPTSSPVSSLLTVSPVSRQSGGVRGEDENGAGDALHQDPYSTPMELQRAPPYDTDERVEDTSSSAPEAAVPVVSSDETCAVQRRADSAWLLVGLPRPKHPPLRIPWEYISNPRAQLRRALARLPQRQPSVDEGETGLLQNSDDDTSDNLQRGLSMTLRRFESTVAFRAAFDVHYRLKPTGDIVVMDVLLSVFLWLEPTQSTLLAVSHVSRAWREASAHLPQWSVTHQLLHPVEDVFIFNTQHGPNCEQFEGLDVFSRDQYMVTMKARTDTLREAQSFVESQKVSTFIAGCIDLRCFAITQWLVGALVVAAAFVAEFYIGAGEKFNGDDGLGTAAFFASIAISIVLLFALTCALHQWVYPHKPLTKHQKNLRRRIAFPIVLLSYVICLSLGTPVALVAARIAQATSLAKAPRVVFSTAICTDPSHFGFNDRPMYVQLENPWEWRIEPWAAGGPAAVDNRTNGSQVPLCRVPPPGRAPRTWWADTYLGNQTLLAALQLEFNESFAQADGIQCTDRLVTSQLNRYDFLMLYPPAELVAACPTATPLALAYDPTRADFNDTVGALWSSFADAARAAEAGKLTSFRTAVETTWFNVPWAHEAGAAWFAASEAALNGSSTALRYNESAVASAYLWERRRIPLVVPMVVPSPEDLKASWWIREYAFFGTAAAVMGIVLLLSMLPKCVSDGAMSRCSVLIAAIALNPLYFVFWGAVCAWGEHPDVCLMTNGDALALFCAGIALVCILLGILIATKCR
jgi:hypothetical protein